MQGRGGKSLQHSAGVHFGGIKAVTFDFYNTLVYHKQGSGRGAMLMEYLREQGLESDPWEHQVLYDVFARHSSDYDPQQSEEQKRRYFRRLAEQVFQRLKVRAPKGASAAHAGNVWKLLGPASLAVFADVPGVLQALQDAGYRLAVVSNWQCGLGHFCTELGIGEAFEHVIASAEVGSAKPEPEIFRQACRRLGVPASQILHVGDSLADDLEGARSAGFQSLLLTRTQTSAAPVISELGCLPDLLA